MTRARKTAPRVCADCRYGHEAEGAVLICRRNPPVAVVVENRPITMRVTVQPADPACGEYELAIKA